MNNHTEVFIKNKCNEIPSTYADEIIKFLPFYTAVSNDDLAYLFAYLHYRYNSLFDFLNHKLHNHHYNADESRELISLIELYRKLDQALIETEFQFKLDDNYLETINRCEIFLSSSGGSSIPDDFQRIYTVEVKPIFELVNLDDSTSTKTVNKKQYKQSKNITQIQNKVFIVHGHDNETKQEVARFIESIGLGVIILHEQASRSMTIIEKIEHYSSEASFAVVLYTPCDKGRGALETKVPARSRARQNVVFEHGYLMARIGRSSVCALVKGEIETPSDISGVVYTPLDSHGGWKNELIKELKACGYKIQVS